MLAGTETVVNNAHEKSQSLECAEGKRKKSLSKQTQSKSTIFKSGSTAQVAAERKHQVHQIERVASNKLVPQRAINFCLRQFLEFSQT